MGYTTGQFNDSFPPIADGVANVVKNYAYWYQKKYGRCCVVTPGYPKYMDDEGFEVIRYLSLPVPGRHPYRAGLARGNARLHQRLVNMPFDLVHAHCPFSTGKLALGLARKKNIPVIATFHSKFYDDFLEIVKSEAIARLLVKQVIRYFDKVDQVWTVNQSTVYTLRDYGYKGPVEVVPNGIDLDVNLDNCALKNRIMQGKEHFQFLFVGQHIWHKNLRLLVEALSLVKEAGVSFTMTMVGEGNAREPLEQLVKQCGLQENFVFTGRINDRTHLREFYERADLFLFPSVYDTFSLVVREAAAVGCPSIVIKNANAAEGIVDQVNGYLAENNAQDFAVKILYAVRDTEKLGSCGMESARTLVRSWESVIDEVSGRYAEIIKGFKK